MAWVGRLEWSTILLVVALSFSPLSLSVTFTNSIVISSTVPIPTPSSPTVVDESRSNSNAARANREVESWEVGSVSGSFSGDISLLSDYWHLYSPSPLHPTSKQQILLMLTTAIQTKAFSLHTIIQQQQTRSVPIDSTPSHQLMLVEKATTTNTEVRIDSVEVTARNNTSGPQSQPPSSSSPLRSPSSPPPSSSSASPSSSPPPSGGRCPRYDGLECNGLKHGKCKSGKCECLNSWSGIACQTDPAFKDFDPYTGTSEKTDECRKMLVDYQASC